jgi:hypothetical protein
MMVGVIGKKGIELCIWGEKVKKNERSGEEERVVTPNLLDETVFLNFSLFAYCLIKRFSLLES